MKITTFNPQIMTKDAEPIIKLFEELGFEKTHTKTDIGVLEVTGIRMKNENGFHLDISTAESFPEGDKLMIRMNVDDIDATYQLLKRHGFSSIYGSQKVESKHSENMIMVSPSGFAINLVKHIKE